MILFKNAKYEGDFFDGYFDGRGKYTFPDGSFYEGEFKKNKSHGIGIRTKSDGTVIKGKWENGVYKGEE